MCIFFSSKYSDAKPGVVANACSPSMWEVEAGELLWVWGQPELHSKFLSSLGYSDVRPYLQKEKKSQILLKERLVTD